MCDVEGMIEREVADPVMTQRDVTVSYAFAIRQGADFGRINRAILSRWKPSGLDRIKRKAWAMQTRAVMP